MRGLPPEIRELISTPIRKEIFKTINGQKDGFTFHELFRAINKKGIAASATSVQNFLKSLRYRGYLEEYSLKETKTAGRSTIHYRRPRS